jgi:hypothetical protein
LVASIVLVVGLVSLLGLLDTTVKATTATRQREGGTNLVQEVLEDARTIPFAQLSSTSIVGQLQAMNGLADSKPALPGWQISRRGITYTVTAEECAVDDPKDGYGKHAGTVFCTDSQAEGTADAQPVDLKRITVKAEWSTAGKARSFKQVSTLSASGAAIGLSASGLTLTSPFVSSVPVITSNATERLTFAVTAPESATGTRWTLEGTEQTSPVRKPGTTEEWEFTWPINESVRSIYVSDGTYLVAVQAIDATGVLGPPVSIPVRLIRGQPAAPSGLVAGFNTVNVNGAGKEVVELEWRANTERNVIGYRVYDTSGTSPRLVCPSNLETLSLSTNCTDFELPVQKPGTREYAVSALYRNQAEVVLEGPAARVTATQAASVAPNPPTNLEAEKQPDGSVKLTWTAPSGETPAFYRIYRGSTEGSSRYAVASATSYTDTGAEQKHKYWVTAVGAHLTESSFAGPSKEE